MAKNTRLQVSALTFLAIVFIGIPALHEQKEAVGQPADSAEPARPAARACGQPSAISTLQADWPAELGTLPELKCEPTISGVLWWLHPHREGPHVEAIIEAMADVGMDLLWIISSNEFMTRRDNPILGRIFDEADQRGWRVILTTSSNGGWYANWDIPALKEIEERNIRALAGMYAHRPSFYGWYINYEIYMEWDERSRKIRDLYNHIGRLTRTITPQAKLTISPFFLVDKDQLRGDFRYAEPDEFGAWWAETLKQSGIDIVMLQDSGELHCKCVPIETRVAFIRAMKQACRAADAELWGNVETVEVPAADMEEYARDIELYRNPPDTSVWSFDMDRNALKLDLASRLTTNIVSWGWEFWNPVLPQTVVGDSRENYAAYKAYYEAIKARQNMARAPQAGCPPVRSCRQTGETLDTALRAWPAGAAKRHVESRETPVPPSEDASL